MLVKTMSGKFLGLCAKSFSESVKDSIMAAEACLWMQARGNVFFF